MSLATATLTEDDIARAKLLKLDYDCSMDPKLFFNTLLWTFDPKRPPFHYPFKLYPFQEERIVDKLVSAIENGYDIFFDKTREMGVSYTCLGVFLWYWKYRDASNFLLGSRKEDFVDNVGKKATDDKSNKEASLFGKLDYMVDRLPKLIKPTGFDPRIHRSSMNLANPELGNIISGESSNPNFSRGGRQKAIALDEFAFWENDDAAWGSTADTTNCRVVITTPGIRPNTKAKRLRFGTDGEKIEVVELPYYLDPRKTPEWLAHEQERRSAQDFAREIKIDWEGSLMGIVYPEAKRREVGHFPYNPAWPLYATWDFGLDGTALQFWQYNPTNGKMRLVDAYAKVDVPIQWWFPFFPGSYGQPKPINSLFQYNTAEVEMLTLTSRFQPAIHFGDPDAAKRSMTSKTLTSVRNELAKEDIYVQTNTKANTFYNRREETKLMFQKGIEVNQTLGITGVEGWLECIDYARYPKREATSQATTAISLPIHDYTSHHRTSTEYLAVNFEIPDSSRGPGLVESDPLLQLGQTTFMTMPSGMSEVGSNINVGSALRAAQRENQ